MIFSLDWNWTAAKNCFLPSVKNWIEAKNYFLPRVELNRCQKLFSASVKNLTEAKRFVRVQKLRITFFLLLPRVRVLSLSHPPPLLLLCSDHSRLLDVWLIRVLAWRSVIWGSRSGHQFLVLQVRGRLMLCVDGDLSLMVARRVGGGNVKKLVVATKVVSRFGGGDTI